MKSVSKNDSKIKVVEAGGFDRSDGSRHSKETAARNGNSDGQGTGLGDLDQFNRLEIQGQGKKRTRNDQLDDRGMLDRIGSLDEKGR